MRLIFAGTPDYALTHLKALVEAGFEVVLVLTQPDKPSGRGQKLTPPPVKVYAQSQNIPVLQPTTLKDQQLYETLKHLNPDLMIVSAYGMLLPENILNLPKMGCWNLHASILPRWRGAAPIQQSLLHGDAKTGITLMQMDTGLDTGPILIQKEIDIDKKDTGQTLHDKLAHLGAKVLIQGLKSSPLKAKPQTGKASYAPKTKKEDARINWQSSTQDIERLIRSFNPWPIAHTLFEEQILKIWEADILSDHLVTPYIAGEIVDVSRKGLDVATHDGILRIKRLQFPNKKPLLIEEILNAKPHIFKVGTILR